MLHWSLFFHNYSIFTPFYKPIHFASSKVSLQLIDQESWTSLQQNRIAFLKKIWYSILKNNIMLGGLVLPAESEDKIL